MSREIKFRAWSNEYKKMFRVSEISMDRDGYVHGLVDAGFKNEYRPENEDFKSPLAWIGRVDFVKSPTGRLSGLAQNTMDEPFYLMQYTGLKDKNGKEIYEGDVLELDDYSPKWLVKYHYDAFIAEGGEFKTQEGLIEFYDWHNECLIAEVVGNIYENPELLEGTA